MVDIRDKKAMIARLREAQAGFEKGAPVPSAGGALLADLVDALADSGPLELGVTPTGWLTSITSAESGIPAADDPPSAKAVRRAKRSVRELRQFFGDRTWSDWLELPFALLLGVPLFICLLPVLLLCLAISRRYPDVHKAIVSLDLPDRVLFAHRVKATLLLATDRRLILAGPSSELPAPSDRRHFSVAWDTPYPRIRSVSSQTVWNGQIVTIATLDRTIAYKLPSDGSEALMAILRRRAPDAFDTSPA